MAHFTTENQKSACKLYVGRFNHSALKKKLTERQIGSERK